MADYLILKALGDGTWQVTTLARHVAVPIGSTAKAEAVKQGYTGPGRYCALDWSARFEFDLGPVVVQVTPR